MEPNPESSEYGEVLSVADVARLLQIEEATVRALARRGDLPGVKLGKHWRFLRDELRDSLRPARRAATTPQRQAAERPTIAQDEAAQLLGVSIRTIHRMVQRGQLEKITAPTGAERLSRASVQAYLGASDSPRGDV